MSTSNPDNTERNARILDLARQGKAQAEIARALGLSRGVVSGVLKRAREAKMQAKPMSPQALEGSVGGEAQGATGEEDHS